MLRIGDAAKLYAISNRTLRYWEDKGILKSVRTENGYRYYDDFNTERIRQIVLLRKLERSISSIESLLSTDNAADALSILTVHLENLRNKAKFYHVLTKLTEQLILHSHSPKTLQSFFESLEVCAEDILSEQDAAFEEIFSERSPDMSENELQHVRIVRLPAMTVASYRAESATPEKDCASIFNEFVLARNLHRRDGFRMFGFNNPSPSADDPVYGYEMWVTVPEDFEVPLPLAKKHFGGGLYASIPTSMNEIGERWQLLYYWCKNSSQYEVDFSIQWLEECSMDFEKFISDTIGDKEKQLDLLEPIREK